MAAILKIFISPHFSQNEPIFMKFCTLKQSGAVTKISLQNHDILKFKMAQGRHIVKYCLTITQREFFCLRRQNLSWITAYWTETKNYRIWRTAAIFENRYIAIFQSKIRKYFNFRKFKMAESRHFKNHYITIFQWKMSLIKFCMLRDAVAD